jgi:hypothetical protein
MYIYLGGGNASLVDGPAVGQCEANVFFRRPTRAVDGALDVAYEATMNRATTKTLQQRRLAPAAVARAIHWKA